MIRVKLLLQSLHPTLFLGANLTRLWCISWLLLTRRTRALRAASKKIAVRFAIVAASHGAKRVQVVHVLVLLPPHYGVVVVAFSPAAPSAITPIRSTAKCIVLACAQFCRSWPVMIVLLWSSPLTLRRPRHAWPHKNSKVWVSIPY